MDRDREYKLPVPKDLPEHVQMPSPPIMDQGIHGSSVGFAAMGMSADDYQLVRVALLHAISPRAGELGEELYVEAQDTIDDLTTRLRAAEEREAAMEHILPIVREHERVIAENEDRLGYVLTSSYARRRDAAMQVWQLLVALAPPSQRAADGATTGEQAV